MLFLFFVTLGLYLSELPYLPIISISYIMFWKHINVSNNIFSIVTI